MRKKSIAFSKALAKECEKQQAVLLSKIRKLKQDIDIEKNFEEYDKTKSELEKICDNIAERVKIRSRWFCYQYG